MTQQIWLDFNEQLLGFIKKRVKNEEVAKDILQEVFLKIHQNINKLKNDKKIANWIYQITRNTIIDYYRKKKQLTTGLPIEEILPEKIELQKSDFSNCISPFIKQLPDTDQDILNKIHFGNTSQKDYAKQQNLSYSATKSRIQRARGKLKALFIECCRDIEYDKYGNIISQTENECIDC